LFAKKQLLFGDNPLMRWATNNVLVVTKKDGNKEYHKKDELRRKTDPFQAFIHAMYKADDILIGEEDFFLADIKFYKGGEKLGLFDKVFRRNKEIGYSFDLDFMELFSDKTERTHMKRLAIEICISFLANTVSQTEFRVKHNKEYIKDELYYRLNVRPNKNMTASTFWQKFIRKLVYDNEVLVIQADDGDLLIADSFTHLKYAVYEDVFKDI